MNPEITIAAARHRARHDRFHLLRHDPDIGLVAAEIAEAVIAEAVVQMPEQDDVVLQRDIGAPATTAATTSTAAEPSAAASTTGNRSTAATAEAAAAHACARHACAGKTCLATCRMSIGRPARRHVPDRRIAPALVARATGTAAVGCLGAITAFRTTTCLGAITVPLARSPPPSWRDQPCPIAGTITPAPPGAVLSGVEPPLAIAAAMVHPVCSTGPQVVVAEFLRNAGVVVADALTVRRIVLPVVSDVGRSVVVIDVEIAVAPVEAAAPVVAPASDRPAGAKRQPCSDYAGTDIGCIAEIIRRIFRIGPVTIDRRRIVVGNVDRIGLWPAR